jgi:hypothetical protein
VKIPGPPWVLPLVFGILAGAVVEWGVTGRTAAGGSLILIAPIVTVLVTFISGVAGGLIPSALSERAEQRKQVREHAQSLTTKVFRWLPQLMFQSDRWELPRPGVNRGGLCVADPSGYPVVVDELESWQYAEAHLLQDPDVGARWRRLSALWDERNRLRNVWSNVHQLKLESALARAFGEVWESGNGFGTPQPVSWYDAATIWNWMHSRSQLVDFKDGTNQATYNNVDFPDETRYTVTSRSATLISSRRGGLRAKKLLELLTALQSDAEIENARKDVVALDESLTRAASELRGPLREFFERTSETGKLSGRCGACP